MADLYKDLVQNLRSKPSTAFSSSGSPLSVVQYVSDTIPKKLGALRPSVASLTRNQYEITGVPHGSISTFTLGTGEKIAIGFAIDGVEFCGFGDTEADHKILIESPDSYSATVKMSEALRQYSFIESFLLDGKAIILDRDGNHPTWTAPSWLTVTTGTVRIAKGSLPKGYRRGDYWKKCKFFRILDAWVEGSDDTHHNITLLVKADLEKLDEESDNVNFPDDLATDGSAIDYPYFGDSENITWEFEVANPDRYTRPPSCTPHPNNPNALLVSEKRINNGGGLQISRVYREIGPVTEQAQSGYQVTYQDPDGANLTERFPIVTVSLDVLLESYTPPQCGSLCPVSGFTACGSNDELTFSSLVLIEPPVLEPQNTVYGRMAAVYGRLPGYVSTGKTESPRFGTVTVFTQRLAKDATPPVKGDETSPGSGEYIIDVSVQEENSCSKTVQWQVAPLPSCVQEGTVFNRETGELDPISQFVIPTSLVPETILALNEGRVSVTALVGGDSNADGTYEKSDSVTFSNAPYFLLWEDPEWSLYQSQEAGPDILLETAVGGGGSSPVTATWSDYEIAIVTDSVGSLNTSGLYATSSPIDCHFSLITQRKASPFVTRSYDTYQSFTWPGVVSQIEMMDWVRQDGASDTYPRVVWSQHAFSGPCRSTITETWSSSPMALDSVDRMIPLPLQYACPAFSIRIPPTLHAAGSFKCDFGSDHSVYAANTGSVRPFPATNYPDWPPSLVVSSVQRPYQGGFLKRTIRIFQPD